MRRFTMVYWMGNYNGIEFSKKIALPILRHTDLPVISGSRLSPGCFLSTLKLMNYEADLELKWNHSTAMGLATTLSYLTYSY